MNNVRLDPLSTRADYQEIFQAFDDDETAIDLTGATIVFELRDPVTQTSILTASTDDGNIEIDTTSFTVSFTPADVRDVRVKEYEVGCTIELEDITTQLFIGTISIVDGIVS